MATFTLETYRYKGINAYCAPCNASGEVDLAKADYGKPVAGQEDLANRQKRHEVIIEISGNGYYCYKEVTPASSTVGAKYGWLIVEGGEVVEEFESKAKFVQYVTAQSFVLPELTGSSKQIAWAEKIRAEAIAATEKFGSLAEKNDLKLYASGLPTDSKSWIDAHIKAHKNYSNPSIMSAWIAAAKQSDAFSDSTVLNDKSMQCPQEKARDYFINAGASDAIFAKAWQEISYMTWLTDDEVKLRLEQFFSPQHHDFIRSILPECRSKDESDMKEIEKRDTKIDDLPSAWESEKFQEVSAYAIVFSDKIHVCANETGLGDCLPKAGRKWIGSAQEWVWRYPVSALNELKQCRIIAFFVNEKGDKI